jgi:nitroreductase
MDAYQAIIAKRDRRDYEDRPIPDEVLQRILQAGRMAGSSSNSQPTRLIVMRDPKSRANIGPAGPGTAPLVKAPLGIVVVIKNGARDFDVGRVAQNMMVAAWAEGIVSCPIGLREEALAACRRTGPRPSAWPSATRRPRRPTHRCVRTASASPWRNWCIGRSGELDSN